MEATTQSPLFELSIDQEAHSYLSETARWAKFLAIVGFVTCGIIAIVSFVIGPILSATAFAALPNGGLGAAGAAMITAVYLAVAVLYFFPCLFLLHFSVRLKAALRDSDQVKLTSSLQSQKKLFKFVGIMTIVILSLYALILAGAVIAAAAFAPHIR
jgi:Family of unknown function (DUF5362)